MCFYPDLFLDAAEISLSSLCSDSASCSSSDLCVTRSLNMFLLWRVQLCSWCWLALLSAGRWWSGSIRGSRCSSGAGPGPCCWTWSGPRGRTRESTRWGFISLHSFIRFHRVTEFVLLLRLLENEGTIPTLLLWDQADRPGHQQNLSEPHHVHGPLRGQVGFSSAERPSVQEQHKESEETFKWPKLYQFIHLLIRFIW